ncbi:uncharacterized protein LOC115926873 [Strongylocentrotus purpuratus]|uniref:C2H2-type domain-containing protein n=1 Tax=Strongylocentrotus purpuratus TaxID=7668 RepID=A0A7M7PAP8_STRPU|nr:uncharacterized protein LOC115926873 [Strongylocentrotus purpuratus]
MDIESLKTHGCRIKAFSCHLCSDTFQTPEQLYNHKCSTQTFTCHMCNKKCSSAKELNQHPCIDTNDIRIGKGSSNAGRDNPMNKGSVVEIETGGKGSTTTGQGAGQERTVERWTMERWTSASGPCHGES